MKIKIPRQKPGDETAPYWSLRDDISVSDAMQMGFQTGTVVTLKCPNGHIGSLRTHQIKASGDVEPSVVCPRAEERCDFHEFITLVGWKDDE